MNYAEFLGRKSWVVIPNWSLDHSSDTKSPPFELRGCSRYRVQIHVSAMGSGTLDVKVVPLTPAGVEMTASAESIISGVGSTGISVGDTSVLVNPVVGSYIILVDHSGAIGNWQYEVSLIRD